MKQMIANRIIEHLKQNLISKGEFAKMCEVSPSLITKWLSGNHNFTVDTLLVIEYALNINIFKR